VTAHADPTTRTTTTAPRAAAGPKTARWRPPVAVGAVVLGLVAGQAAAAAIILAAGGRDAADELTAVALLVADAIVLAIVLAFAARGAEHLTPATLGVRRTSFWPAVGWTLAIWVGISALEGLWALLVGGTSETSDEGTQMGTAAMLVILLAVAVTAPIVEEITFRGYLFPALIQWRGPWVAAALTAILFGAAHVASSPPAALPALAVFGFGACLLFWFTGSILPCVGLHAANNAIVVGVASDWGWQVPVALLACVTLSIVVLRPFARTMAPQRAE
jgi:membrane protease YdiL (CAAX protease family)